jgi:hypothetical protein
MRVSRGGAYLPIELTLLSAEYLKPVDLLSLLCAAPGLARLLTIQHTTLHDEGGRSILHLLAREGEGELIKLLLANAGIRPDPGRRYPMRLGVDMKWWSGYCWTDKVSWRTRRMTMD